MQYAFSGGQVDIETHRRLGGNPDVDVSFQYLKFLSECPDEELQATEAQYRSGELLTGELKKKAIQVIQDFVTQFQSNRSQVTAEILDQFMDFPNRHKCKASRNA